MRTRARAISVAASSVLDPISNPTFELDDTAELYAVSAPRRVEWPLDFEPLVVHPIGVGLSRQAPHPNAALLFIDFLLTDAQKIFLGRETRPTNIRVAPEPSPAVYIDHAIALDQSTKWRKIFRDVLVSRAR